MEDSFQEIQDVRALDFLIAHKVDVVLRSVGGIEMRL
jgi:hypothetical protein